MLVISINKFRDNGACDPADGNDDHQGRSFVEGGFQVGNRI